MPKIQSSIATALIAVLSVYQKYISPFLGSRCRFYPSCSTYAKSALLRYGLRTGVGMALGRLMRCHPFSPGGVDDLLKTTTSDSRAHTHLVALTADDHHIDTEKR